MSGQDWSWDQLLTDALRVGLTIAEFWDATPKEIGLLFERDIARQVAEINGRMSLAWHIAALMRQKTLPSLSSLMASVSRRLHGDELERRRREHAEIVERLNG